MADKNKKDNKSIQVDIDEVMAQGIYSNMVISNYSQEEFVLDFVFLQPQQAKGKIRSRIILSPKNAKRLLKLLSTNVKDYEKHLKDHFDIKSIDQEQEVEKQLNELEEDRFKIDAEIEKEQELIKEQLEEMGIETDPDDTTPDVYEALMNDLVEIEEEDEDDK